MRKSYRYTLGRVEKRREGIKREKGNIHLFPHPFPHILTHSWVRHTNKMVHISIVVFNQLD